MFQNLLDFICDYCNRSFTRKYNLQMHIENYHLNSTCYCDICDQRFGTPAGLQLHLNRGHNRYSQPNPECDICGRIFTRKQNLMSHMNALHCQGGVQFQCKSCDKSFTTEKNLKRHINQLHNPDVQYPTCNECKKVFKGKHSLIAHIQSVHIPGKHINKCNLCEKVYTNTRNLKRHVEFFHGDKGEFRCDLCPKVYTSNHSLKRHSKAHHFTPNADQYTCEYCNKVLFGKDNLEAHILFAHKQDHSMDCSDVSKTDVVCVSCSKTFNNEPLLRHHVKTEHNFKTFYKYCRNFLLKQEGRDSIRSSCEVYYKCEFCFHGFTNVYELKDHMRLSHDKEYCLSTCNVCFSKFYSKETVLDHKEICLPPPNVKSCSHCDKLFTDISSLEFHTRIFHPQAQIADSHITSTNENESADSSYKCGHCDRIYYSDRSLKHHIKLKHTTDEAMECEYCGKICSNKYYLASHVKIVHNNDSWSKCGYCDKQFKSKRNIRRHIEYTHLGMQRYKCIECETLFKEKRSLRKHVRTKHPDSTAFPQCHICQKRFESAKSCKIHLKLLHSFNMNTFPCDLCSVSFGSNEALSIHLQTKHLAEDEIYKCEECNLVFKGQERFEQHNEGCHVKISNLIQKVLPRCIICMKDFSTRKTLKRHIKKFHEDFDVEDLVAFGAKRRNFTVDCQNCVKNFNDDNYYNVYQKLKHLKDSIIFTCEACSSSYTSLEYSIERYRLTSFDGFKGKMILSEFCTTEMSDNESNTGFSLHETAEAESTTSELNMKVEPLEEYSDAE